MVNTIDFDPIDSGSSPDKPTNYMVSIAQLAEHLIVVQEVVGSFPIRHPKNKIFF